MSSAYLRLLIFLPAILIPACVSSSPAFLMMYSAYKLNKQGDNIQPWRILFPIWNQSVVPYPILTVASWPAYKFLKSWFNFALLSVCVCVCVCVCVGFYPLPTLTLFSSTWFSFTCPVFLYIKYFPINCSYWQLTQYNAFTEGKRRDKVNSWGFPQASTYICANGLMRYVNIFSFVPIFFLHH